MRKWIAQKSAMNRMYGQEDSVVRVRRYADSTVSMTTNTEQADTPFGESLSVCANCTNLLPVFLFFYRD